MLQKYLLKSWWCDICYSVTHFTLIKKLQNSEICYCTWSYLTLIINRLIVRPKWGYNYMNWRPCTTHKQVVLKSPKRTKRHLSVGGITAFPLSMGEKSQECKSWLHFKQSSQFFLFYFLKNNYLTNTCAQTKWFKIEDGQENCFSTFWKDVSVQVKVNWDRWQNCNPHTVFLNIFECSSHHQHQRTNASVTRE